VGLGQVRLEQQRALVRRAGLREFALGLENVSEVGMVGRGIAIGGDGLAYQAGGSLMISVLVGDHSQQVQAVCVVRVQCQYLPIDALRFVQPAGLVMAQGLGHHGAGRCGGRFVQ